MSSLPLTVPDLVWTDDMDLFAAETTSDLQTLEQDVFHILVETPGSNPDDPDRGIGISAILSSPITTSLADIARTVDAELVKDDRIDTSKTTLSQLSDGTYLLEVDIVASGAVLGLSYTYTAADGLVSQ